MSFSTTVYVLILGIARGPAARTASVVLDHALGEDQLVLVSFTGSRGISRLFRFQLDMISESRTSGDSWSAKRLPSRGNAGGQKRPFHGHVSQFMAGTRRRAGEYRAKWSLLWFLTARDCRIFQDKKVGDHRASLSTIWLQRL